MSRLSIVVLASAISALAVMSNAQAENSPNLRDCSFGVPPGAVDQDFVILTGMTVRPDLASGTLIALPNQNVVHVTASESADANDHTSSNAVHITATVSAPGTTPVTVANNGLGWATVQVPLNGSSPGLVYTIAWSATFDGGGHTCPSSVTPQNTGPNPFTIKIVKAQ